MPLVPRLRAMWSNLFRKGRVEAELDAELAATLEQLVEEKIAAGMAPAAARRAARVELGGVEQVKEEVRAVRAGVWLETLGQDLRYAARAVARNPGFSTVVVLTLALGIGVNTAIFSLVNALLYKPLPGVTAPERLAWLRGPSSYPDFLAIAERQQAFAAVTAMGGSSRFSLRAGAGVERITGELVSHDYFAVFGAPLQLGRGFLPDDDRAAAAPVVVLSDALWRRRFGADPGIVGRTVSVNGLDARVVGVGPRGFFGGEVGLPRELWIPLELFARVAGAGEGMFAGEGVDRLGRRDAIWLNVAGRLRDGVALDEASAQVTAIAGALADEHHDEDRAQRVAGAALLPVIGGLDPRDRLDAVAVAAVLMIIVGLVLLVACANVAGLMLARAAARARELGVRRALGASRPRLVRQLLCESLLLALAGGAAGLAVAVWTGQAIVAVAAVAAIVPPDLALDGRVLGYTLAVSVATALLSGLAPALRASRPDVMGALRGAAPAGLNASRLRRALVIAQVALSTLLLVAAGLFARSLARGRHLDPGFVVERALLVDVDLDLARVPAERGRALYARLLAEVAALPGVEAATLLRIVPLGLSAADATIVAGDSLERAGFNVVGPGYLAAMGIPLRAGRDLDARDDAAAPPAVVVNEILARRLYPDGDAVGKPLRFGRDGAPMTIVGVAAGARERSLAEEARPFLYLPLGQRYQGSMTLVVRARGDARALAAPVAGAVRRLDPALPVVEPRLLAEQLDVALMPSRVGASLLGGFGLLALALAAIGMYGLVAYTVRQRTHEIGVRRALGARGRDVVRLVTRQVLRVVAVGLAIGIAIAFAATRVLESVLVGVSTTDLVAFAGAPLMLLAVAAVASFLPARRAARVDPMIALRVD